jgi:hypothetical protein
MEKFPPENGFNRPLGRAHELDEAQFTGEADDSLTRDRMRRDRRAISLETVKMLDSRQLPLLILVIIHINSMVTRDI